MKKLFVVLLSTVSFLLFTGVAFAKTDASLSTTDIAFSKSELVAGQTVRVYARVFDAGDTDVSAYVQFTNNGNDMAAPQPVSLRPNTYDDVFIDWTVAAGTNNIQAKIIGTNPQDSTPANDQTTVKTVMVAAPVAKPAQPTASDVQPLPAEQPTTNWQDVLTNFQDSNPVKSGIASLDQGISDNVVKWYKLALGGKLNGEAMKNSVSSWPAGIVNAVGPFLASKNAYVYIGIGLLAIIVLFFLFRRRKPSHEEYYD